MSPHCVLPMEIFEAIIDQASDDTAVVRRLSLICHAFLPRARYQLFSSVFLQTIQRVESFGEFLDSHPWVRPLVQKLVHSSSFIPIDQFNSTVDLLDAVPIRLLSRLPNLRTWKMGVPEDQENAWVPSLQSGPSPPIYSSHIRNLELAFAYLKHIYVFVDLVSAFTGIHTLACSNIVIASAREIELGPISPHSRSLKVSVSDPQYTSSTSLRLGILKVSTSVDVGGLKYLLNSTRTISAELALTIDLPRPARYFGEPLNPLSPGNVMTV